MQVESLGEAITAGWRVHARCLGGVVDNTRSRAKSHYQAELSLETLVWTRGRSMPPAGLRDRMMCPKGGNGRVNLGVEPPPIATRVPVAQGFAALCNLYVCRARRHGGWRFSGWILKECRLRCAAWRGRRGTSRRHSPCRPEAACFRHGGQHRRRAIVVAQLSSLNSMTSGRPRPSQIACSLEFRPPLERPIRRGTELDPIRGTTGG